MVKLIESSQFADVPEIGAKFAEFNSPAMKKEAETIFGRSYESLKPTDDKYVGIHLVALGDEEHYGQNRNNDAFPKVACVRYHDTFVKHGHVFAHHHNDAKKDPILGSIKASAYNEKMGRIELFIWADKEKAAEGLDQLEKEGAASFSMACSVPGDRCSICGAFRKNASDPNMCDHIRNQLGKIAENGKTAYMINDNPTWFDISFVTRPADRIAYSLKVADEQSDGLTTSEALAKAAGIVEPPWLEPGLVADKRAVLRKLADAYEDHVREPLAHGMFSPVAKEAESRLDDETIETLRKMPVKEAMAFLLDSGTFLGPRAFCRYAMGPKSAEFAEVGPRSAEVGRLAAQAIKEAAWLDRFDFTQAGDFDVDRFTTRPSTRFTEVARAGFAVKRASFDEDNILDLVAASNAVAKTAEDRVDGMNDFCFNTVDKPILAVALKYAEYKVAALNAALSGTFGGGTSNTRNGDALLALVAAQDL